MRDEIETHLHPRNYTQNEVYRIINPKQIRLYIKNNVYMREPTPRQIDKKSRVPKEEKGVWGP